MFAFEKLLKECGNFFFKFVVNVLKLFGKFTESMWKIYLKYMENFS